MALFGTLATLRAQAPQTPGFAAAFSYLDEVFRRSTAPWRRMHEMVAGQAQKVELPDGAFAIEQVYATKPRVEGFFESHRKYIDVQVIVEGAEVMEVIDAARVKVRQPYAEDRDLVIYDDAPDANVLRVQAGEGAIFFPADVHMPSLHLHAEPVLVRKSVVKILVG